jgi:excisionase family DNA binding protein
MKQSKKRHDTKGRLPMSNAESREPPDTRLAYSVAEAAMITGLSRDLLYDQMRAGKLAYLKVGRRRLITRQHLEAFLAPNR